MFYLHRPAFKMLIIFNALLQNMPHKSTDFKLIAVQHYVNSSHNLLETCNDWLYYNMRNGARVRHTTARGHRWEGVYDSIRNVIVCNGNVYNSPSKFARQHNLAHAPWRRPNDNGKQS